MAEKVLIRTPGSTAAPRRVDARLAQYLVYRGRAEYVQQEGEVDVEFRPSETLDVKPKAKKAAKKKGTYKRRDLKAEE